MTCKDPDLEQVTEVVGVEVKVKVMNKLAIEGGGEGENRGCRQGGPTKLPAMGGGQQQRPGKEEPLVGWRKEGASDHHQSWSQFLVGFFRPVRRHPPDDGRLSEWATGWVEDHLFCQKVKVHYLFLLCKLF